MKTKNKLIVILLNCFFPVFIGGLIYIGYRTSSLLMFKWFEIIGLEKTVELIRFLTFKNLPDIIIFSLPNALWMYSFIFSILYVWKDSQSNNKYFWISIVIFIGIGSEIGQFFKLIPGIFDYYDFVTILISILLAFYFERRLIK